MAARGTRQMNGDVQRVGDDDADASKQEARRITRNAVLITLVVTGVFYGVARLVVSDF